METVHGEPYNITLEIVNDRCKGLRILKDSRVKNCRLVDIRSTSDGLTRHLVRVSSEEIEKFINQTALVNQCTP